MLALLGLTSSSQPAGVVERLLLDLLAAHNDDGLPIQFDWSDLDKEGLRGVDVLRAFEQERLAIIEQPTPARSVEVVEAIIKRTVDGTVQYFMQYDVHGGRFQPIGGKCDPEDADTNVALRREMFEELALSAIPDAEAVKLRQLDTTWSPTEISSTYGILTAYTFSFYLVEVMRVPLRNDPNNAWLTRAEIEAGTASDGRAISQVYVDAFGWGKLDRLPETIFE